MTIVDARFVRRGRDRTVMTALERAVSETAGATPDTPLRVGIILADGVAQPLFETTVGRFWLEELYRAMDRHPDGAACDRVTFEVAATPTEQETKSWD